MLPVESLYPTLIEEVVCIFINRADRFTTEFIFGPDLGGQR